MQVGQHLTAPPAQYPLTDPHQPMGRAAARVGASGGLQRAVTHLESHLRATRQDALQLATAVVRLEKEKAALQRTLKQQGSVQSRGLHQTLPNSTGDYNNKPLGCPALDLANQKSSSDRSLQIYSMPVMTIMACIKLSK